MTIPPFKPKLLDKEKAYVDRFEIRHDRQMAAIKKEKQIKKREILHDRQVKVLDQIREEKIVLKENNERWKQLNIIR